MHDSRLIQMWAMAQDCQNLAEELLDETDSRKDNPHDLIAIARAQKFAAALEQASRAAYSEPKLCGKHSCLGSKCVREEDHEDPEHRSEYGTKWTDESDRRAGEAIARSMEGKRD